MAIQILADGCRSTTANGEVVDKYCDQCPQENGCDLAPRARRLARSTIGHWVDTRDRLPPTLAPLLYVTCATEAVSGSLHLGRYNRRRRSFIDQGSSEATPQGGVAAWLLIPEIPAAIQAATRLGQVSEKLLTEEIEAHFFLD